MRTSSNILVLYTRLCFGSSFPQVSANFVQINPLQWTPYIQQCCDNILETPENDNDVYLAHLSQLQRISEDIRHCGIRSFPSQPRTWNGAVGVHFKLLMSELLRFKGSLPHSLQEDGKGNIPPFLISINNFDTHTDFHPTHSPDDVELPLRPAVPDRDLLLNATNRPYSKPRSPKG
jgi:hypothetical protein